jgi:hypothetical protein
MKNNRFLSFRRIYNEFSTNIDLNSPDGLLRSADVDHYIDKALKPLIEEGKAFKRVSVDRRTGTRTTRYAYQGGKNIQDSINTLLANMPEALGYEIDPATGNVSGTNAPPPMTVNNLGRHYYNETRERILDPRTAASIKAQALRAGGVSTTDKASGYTTTLVRAGLSGETRAMRQLVNESDQKYLSGELPSSALADGASPATIEERARAQVARQANLKDARQAATEDYIRRNPTSQLAIETAMKLQRVTNREEKARLLEAERTPGTTEFQSAVERKLDKNVATDRAELAWAKKHKNLPRAKQILKANRLRTRTGRALEKAKSAVKSAAIGAAIGLITSAVAAMVKFLSVLPNVAANVHKLATKGALYNIPEAQLSTYKTLEKAIGLDGSGNAFMGVAGQIQSSLGSKVNGDVNGIINKYAALSSISGNRATNAMIRYFTEESENPLESMNAAIDDLMYASITGKTVKDRSGSLTPNKAFGYNVKDFEAAFGQQELASNLFEYWQKLEGSQKQKVTSQVIAGGSFMSAIQDVINNKSPPLTPIRVATQVQSERAEEVAKSFEKLQAAFDAIKEGILLKIFSALEPVSHLLRSILKGVLTFANAYGPLKGQFTETLNIMNSQDAQANADKKVVNDAQIRVTEIQVKELRQQYGFTDEVKREQAIKDYERGILPANMSLEEAQNYFGAEFMLGYVKKKDEELEKQLQNLAEGKNVGEVSGIGHNSYGSALYGYEAAAAYTYGKRIDDIYTRYGTDMAGLQAARDAAIVEKQASTTGPFAGSAGVSFGSGVYTSRSTGEEYSSLDQYLEGLDDYIKTLDSAIAGISSFVNEGAYKRGSASLAAATNARNEAEQQVLASQIIENIRVKVGEEFFSRLENGTVRVVGELSADKREYTFWLKDPRTGKALTDPITDYNSIGRSMNLSTNDNINFRAAREAVRPTPP